jgi:biotin transport system substrate-specific component
MSLKASTMARVALMAALAAVGAQIAIPLPFSPVPFTLQVPAVILSGLLLGSRHGALSQIVYLLLGAAGAPVFAQFSGGFAHLVGPTGGYLLSYPLAAAVAGLAAGAVANAPRPRALGTSLLAGVVAWGSSTLSGQPGWAPSRTCPRRRPWPRASSPSSLSTWQRFCWRLWWRWRPPHR